MKVHLVGQLNADAECFARSSGALTEDDSTFAPIEGVFTVAQHVAHAAQTIEWFVDGAFSSGGFNMDFAAADEEVRGVTSLTAARAWFDSAVVRARCAVYAQSDEEWAAPLPAGPVLGGQPRWAIFGAITDHTAHHRGALTVYARLRGKVPPMSYMDAVPPAGDAGPA
jgi:uncharacterized damage-inducible protein DinB